MARTFHQPTTVPEALRLKLELGPAAVFLAGGTEVNSRDFEGPEHVISLAALSLGGIRPSPEGVRVGAAVTLQELLEAPELPAPLRQAAFRVGNRNIRNQATIGGHLGANKPWADVIPTLLALEAWAHLETTAGARRVPVEDLVVDCADGGAGLITAVVVPPLAPGRRACSEHFGRTASDPSVVTAAAALTPDAGRVGRPIVAVGGVAGHVLRLRSVEEALADRPPPAPEAIEELVMAHVFPAADVRGSVRFKRALAGALAARAVRRCWDEAGHE